MVAGCCGWCLLPWGAVGVGGVVVLGCVAGDWLWFVWFVWLCVCIVVWLYCCVGILLCGCIVGWLCGCMVVVVCTVVWL